VVVIGHEAVGVAYPIVTFIDMLDSIKKVLAVMVVFEDGLLLVPTRRYMIDCTGIFYAKRTGHEKTIA